MKIHIFLTMALLWLAAGNTIQSQTLLIKGQVLEEKTEKKDPQPVPFANVYWLNTQTGTVTDQQGQFSIAPPSSFPARLVISHVQFRNDTLLLKQMPDRGLTIHLKASILLKTVEKVERRNTTTVSVLDTRGVQYISSAELKKAPCCNLSESFETNASVDVVYADAISGARKIQMLGLDGIYAQILSENIPLIRGLSSAYGLSFVPGPWIESISINKGTGSVLHGFESISGQINVEYFKPGEADHYFLNLFGGIQGRLELNGYFTAPARTKWKSMTLAHLSRFHHNIDGNGDGFLDMPRSEQVNILHRWKYSSQKQERQISLQIMDWQTTGGQVRFDPDGETDTTSGYGVQVGIRQYSLLAKNGFLFPGHSRISLGLLGAVRRTEQDSRIGLRPYRGLHDQGYGNAIFQYQPGNKKHLLKTGAGLQVDHYEETFIDSVFGRNEIAGGPFAEYRYDDSLQFSLLAGLRADYHNIFGWLVSPRIHANFRPADLTAIRVSLGRGFRSPHVFMENPSIFASSRKVVVEEELKAEEAWSTGLSLTHKFTLWTRKASLGADYYYTHFTNQAVVDLDRHAQAIYFYNLRGQSYSHSAQADISIEPAEGWELRISARRYDVRTTTAGNLNAKALVPLNRMMANVAWQSRSGKWKADYTLNAFGSARIPSTATNPVSYRRPGRSPSYITMNTQVTREFRRFEAYLGMENITGYTQKDPIISANRPFGPYFDGSLIWGPLNGRSLYGGIRMVFN